MCRKKKYFVTELHFSLSKTPPFQEEEWKSPTRIQLILDLLDALNNNVSTAIDLFKGLKCFLKKNIHFLYIFRSIRKDTTEMGVHSRWRGQAAVRGGRVGGWEVPETRTGPGDSSTLFIFMRLSVLICMQIEAHYAIKIHHNAINILQKLLDLSYEKGRERGVAGAFAECTSSKS